MVLPDTEDSSFSDCSQKLREPSINGFSDNKEHLNNETQYLGFFGKKHSLPENELSDSDVHPMDIEISNSDDIISAPTENDEISAPTENDEISVSTENDKVSAPTEDDKISASSEDDKVSAPNEDDKEEQTNSYAPVAELNANLPVSIFETTQSNCLQKNDEENSVFDKPEINVDKGCSKEVKVPCLLSLESLKDICQKEGLSFNDYEEGEVEDEAAYEVDMIFGHKIIDKETHYHIKWKNYPSAQNTWEPICNLSGCQTIITYYRAMQGSKPRVNKNLLEYFVRDLISRKPYDILTMTKACALCYGTSEKYVTSLKLTISQMKVKIKEILNFSNIRIAKLQKKLFEIMRFGEARKQVLISLKEWQDEINSSGRTAFIEVENNVDLETAPSEFTFIHDYMNAVVSGPEEPLTFCSCQDCYKEKDSCCPHDSEGYFAYNRFQRLILEPGYPIFECNSKCHCDSSCVNRVVQHGQKVKVAIFRTANGCGWGLKTLETIERGQFVLEYLGEIITSEEAEARGRIYDYVGRSYLFDLDYGVDETFCNYTVDAGHHGNAAHFINHSCDPNLHVYAVWINQPDPNLPRLAFFAKRRINKGEELTFDYKMEQNPHFNPLNLEEQNHERIACQCKSKNCRKYLF